MALVVKDRVQETSVTTGTGTLTLDGAVTGYQTFSSAIGNTNTTYYAIQNNELGEWEVGIGTVSAGALSRDTILESSNGGTAVNFSAGEKQVFCTYPAERSVDISTAQTLTNKTIDGSSNTITNVSLTTGVTGTLPVANGGTGATTLTSNNVILGNGTSAVQFVAPGTSGNVLTSNGTTWTSATSSSLTGVTQSTTPFLTALGTGAGTSTTGVNNTFIGYEAGLSNTSQTSNTAVGYLALRANNSGNRNTAIGDRSQALATQGSDNVSIGEQSLYSRSIGAGNVAVGSGAGLALTSGTNNTFLGHSVGYTLTTGNNNIIIGENALPSSATVSNETTIGKSNVTSARIFGDLKFLNSYTEQVFAVTGTTPALSPTNGTIQTWTLSGNSTPTAGTWANGQSLTLMVLDGTAFTITWTSVAVTWTGGSAPTLDTTKQNVIELWKVGGVVYGASVGAA